MVGMDYRCRALIVMVAACGDNSSGPVPEVEARCREVPWTSKDQFSRSSELEPAVAYSLGDDFDPSGRWFLTGMALGSIRLERDSDGNVQILDGRGLLERSSTELFFTVLREPDGILDQNFRSTVRISNLRDDGTLRFDRAFCEDEVCSVCTAGMVRAERHDPQPSEKLTRIGSLDPAEWKGRTYDVKVVGTTAYMIRGDGLWSIDVADPTKPVIVGHHADPDGETRSNDVALFDAAGARYAIIADTPVQIVDVTNPADLRLAAQLPVEAHTVFTETRAGTTRAYLGSYDGTTPVYDVTSPASFVRLGAFDARASYVHDLHVEDGIGYLNAWEKGFFVVDFTNPAQPVQLGHWQSAHEHSHASWVTTVGGRRVAVHGEELYDAYMTVLDVDPASPAFMQPLGSYQTREYVSIHNFTGVGTKTYFTHYQDGVRVVELADPTRPALVGYYNTWDPSDLSESEDFFTSAIGLDLDLARKLIFVADTDRGLLILRDDTQQ
jgi:hypothetical protein